MSSPSTSSAGAAEKYWLTGSLSNPPTGLFGTWEPDLAALLRRRLRPGDTFVDVGANIGCVSALASRLVGPRGTVVAIEPSPAVIAALQETLTRNDLTNVRMVAAAV